MPEIFMNGVDLTGTPAKGFRRPQAATEGASRSYVDAPPAGSITAATTLALAAAGTVFDVDSATAITVTIPLESSVAYEVGTKIHFTQIGVGKLSLAGAAGVTLRSPGGLLGTRVQWSTITARKKAANEWVLSGDLG